MLSTESVSGNVWFDSHCHLNAVADRVQRQQEASAAGIQNFLVPATHHSDWRDVLALRSGHVSVALGIHPWFVTDSSDEFDVFQRILDQYHTDIRAIGEIGLDFYPGRKSRPDPSLQRHRFEQQLSLAVQYQLPVIVHSVKAHAETLQILRSQKQVAGVIHAFSGSYEQAKGFVESGFSLGVGPMILKSPKTRNAFAKIPLDRLVLETDAPYMQKDPEGCQNPLLGLLEVAQVVADAKQVELGEVQRVTTANARRLFNVT